MKQLSQFILTLGAAAIMSVPAFAQQTRSIDIAATLNAPDSNVIVYSGDTLHTQIAVTNNGPDSLVAGDTLLYYFLFNASEGGSGQTGILLTVLTQSLAAGGPAILINQDLPFSNGTPYSLLHLSFCVHILDPNTEPVVDADNNPITVSYNDPDISNNTGCTSFILMDSTDTDTTTAIATLTDKSVKQLKLFPNPAHDQVSFSLPSMQPGHIRVSVRDITGRVVLQKDYTIQQATVIKPVITLPVAELHAGVYFIEVKSRGTSASGKLIIAR